MPTENNSIVKSVNKVLIGCLIVAILLPIIINCVFCYFHIPSVSDLTNKEWLGFFGSYLGGAFSGIFAIIAVIYTLKQNERNNKETLKQNENIARNLQRTNNAPFITVDLENCKMNCGGNFRNKKLSYPDKFIFITAQDEDIYITTEANDYLIGYSDFSNVNNLNSITVNLTNIGVGLAKDIYFKLYLDNLAEFKRNYYPDADKINLDKFHLNVKGTNNLIFIYDNCGSIILRMQLFYKDICDNMYTQEIAIIFDGENSKILCLNTPQLTTS